MLEEMGAFFDRRLEGYEAHQPTAIAGAEAFYPMTAERLSMAEEAHVLEEETLCREALNRHKREQGLAANAFYHYDVPLTVEHETRALREAGFAQVEALARWGQTWLLRAM